MNLTDHNFWRQTFVVGLCALISLASPLALPADEPTTPPPFFATVVSITDGNSLIIKREGGDLEQVVLAFLSIPRDGQPYSGRAHAVLEAQLLNRRVSIRSIGPPTNDYRLGLVYIGQHNFNLEFLSRGYAWVDYYQISHPAWLRAQQAAKSAGLGLYADPDAKHPMDWSIDIRKAGSLVAITQQMQSDPMLPTLLAETYVGNRKTKVFVRLGCVQMWSTWPQSAWIPFTSSRGAASDGYQEISCETEKIATRSE